MILGIVKALSAGGKILKQFRILSRADLIFSAGLRIKKIQRLFKIVIPVNTLSSATQISWLDS